MNQVAVNDYDRFSFAFFMAALVHALIVFGVSFSLPERQNSATTLEVTLAQYASDQAPDDADFLAQFNQVGSGTLDEKAEMTTTQTAEYAAEVIQETQPNAQEASAPKTTKASTKSLVSQQSQLRITSTEFDYNTEAEDAPVGPKKSLLERSLEIASLEAKLDFQRQELSKRPRTRRLTATSTRSSDDALYMTQWMYRIEQLGVSSYPIEARRNNIEGQLRMLVSLQADGTIREVKILESSGHSILDDAAIRIVRQAAPFQPFPDAMRKNTDILEIIRTWEFKLNRFSTNG